MTTKIKNMNIFRHRIIRTKLHFRYAEATKIKTKRKFNRCIFLQAKISRSTYGTSYFCILHSTLRWRLGMKPTQPNSPHSSPPSLPSPLPYLQLDLYVPRLFPQFEKSIPKTPVPQFLGSDASAKQGERA